MTKDRLAPVLKMFDSLKDSPGRRIYVSRAFDYYTRQATIDKLHAMSIQVGTPDILQDRKFLKIMFKDMQVQRQDFFENILYGLNFLRRKEEQALISPGEETRWMSELLNNKVSYAPAANKVIVPEYLLQPPICQPNFPLSVNMGGLGVMMAEALVEGVLGTGSVFSINGELLDGDDASNFTLKRPTVAINALKRPSQCLLSAYSAFGVDTPDQLTKASLNTAVGAVALSVAYSSFSEMTEDSGGSILPGLQQFDPPSLFFLSYTQSLCSTRTLQQRGLDRTLQEGLLEKERLRG